MCGPLAAAFSLAQPTLAQQHWTALLQKQLFLNSGRLLSYALVGSAIGGLGSAVVAGGQVAGIGSHFRQIITIITGLMLIWLGILQINPTILPRIPFLHPLLQAGIHTRLSQRIQHMARQGSWWTPLIMGLAWGLIPCGFLYTAQLKAAETSSVWGGLSTMLAFGAGTTPMMVGIGVSTSFLSADRRSQLFRAGGWITVLIGILTLLRTDAMVDYTGHAALLGLMLALSARPLSRLWPALKTYRRVLGVGSFVLALIHTAHMLEHTFEWNLNALGFMLPAHRTGISLGFGSLVLMAPAALTSFDRAMIQLGSWWRPVHLLCVPALLFVTGHVVLTGSHYLGDLEITRIGIGATVMLLLSTTLVLLIRHRKIWSLIHMEKWYASPAQRSATSQSRDPNLTSGCH